MSRDIIENEFIIIDTIKEKVYEKGKNGKKREIPELKRVARKDHGREFALHDENIVVKDYIRDYPSDRTEYTVYVKNNEGVYESLTEKYYWMKVIGVQYDQKTKDIKISEGSSFTEYYSFANAGYGYEIISNSEYGTGVYKSIKNRRKEEHKNRPQKIYKEDGFFMSKDFKFYRFKEEEGKRYYQEIKPIKEKGAIEIYKIAGKQFFVSTNENDKRQLALKNERGDISDVVFMDKDFMYSIKEGEAKSWYMMSRKKDGSYQNINSKLLGDEGARINYINYKANLLYLDVTKREGEDISIYYMKGDNAYNKVSKKDALRYLNDIVEKPKEKDKEESTYWHPVSNLDKAYDFSPLSNTDKKKRNTR